MGFQVMTGPAPAKKMRGVRCPEVYQTAAKLEDGQWFVWDDGKPKCLAGYRRTLVKFTASAEVYVDALGRVVFASKKATKATTPDPEPEVTAEPVRRGPGRPPGSGRLRAPSVDPREIGRAHV